MARRTSRRRSTRRNKRRKSSRRRRTRRNPKYVVANRKRRRRSSRRRKSRRPRRNSRRRSSRRRATKRNRRRRSSRMRRNQAAMRTDVMREVITPVLGGTAGFMAARYLGNLVAMNDWGTTDTKVAKTGAAALGIPATFMLARQMPGGMVARNQGSIVLGMGLAAAEAWLKDTKLLGGSPAAAQVTEGNGVLAPNGNGNGNGAPAADAGTGSYYDYPMNKQGQALSAYYDYPTNQQGQALSDDYYTAGMLGDSDPSDQSQVEATLDQMESGNGNGIEPVSTVIPTDTALVASSFPQWSPVKERFTNRSGRAHAGGMFARNLFSGMMGS